MRRYADKTDAELAFIVKDAGEAAACARDLGNTKAEGKYRDQVCDAASERYRRQMRVKTNDRGRSAQTPRP